MVLESSPARGIALPTGIPSGFEKKSLFFRFIAYTKSKREKNLSPYDRTAQFLAGLHCQAIKGMGKQIITLVNNNFWNFQQEGTLIFFNFDIFKTYMIFAKVEKVLW